MNCDYDYVLDVVVEIINEVDLVVFFGIGILGILVEYGSCFFFNMKKWIFYIKDLFYFNLGE